MSTPLALQDQCSDDMSTLLGLNRTVCQMKRQVCRYSHPSNWTAPIPTDILEREEAKHLLAEKPDQNV